MDNINNITTATETSKGHPHRTTAAGTSRRNADRNNFNAKGIVGNTPLHVAVKEYNREWEPFSIDGRKRRNSDSAKEKNDRVTELYETVEQLIKEGADVYVIDNEGKTPLHHAVERDPSLLKLFLSAGKDINITDGCGDTPLYGAVRHSNLKTIELLLQAGADINATNTYYKYTPLHLALSKEGGRHIIEFLIEKGADVEKKDFEGNSPLHSAVQHHNLEYVELLLRAGAKVNTRNDFNGNTPLLTGVKKHVPLSIIDLLIKNNADVNKQDSQGNTSLHEVILHDNCDLVVKMLMEAGSSINISNRNGDTPLDLCIVKNIPVHIVKMLIKNRTDVDRRDYDGYSPLYKAVLCNNHDIVNFLLQAGANINLQNELGDTPLRRCIEENISLNMIELLVKKGADVSIRDSNGNSAIHEAVHRNNLGALRLLVQAGADVNAENKYGSTPLLVCASKHVPLKKEIVNFLLGAGANINAQTIQGNTPLHLCVERNIPLNIELLLQNHADINAKDNGGNSALHKAVRRGNLDSIKLLLEARADIHSQNRRGNTPLHLCITENVPLNIIELLVKNNADVNVKNSDGDSALHEAVRSDKLESVKLLVQAGADVNAQNKHGWTPLHEGASTMAQLDIIELFLKNNAHVNKKDSEGCSPLHRAVIQNSIGIVGLLLEAGADINARNEYGNAPLHLSIPVNLTLNVMELLWREDANLNMQNCNGDTPLHLAVSTGNLQIVETLLFLNADTSIVNSDDNTPLMVAFDMQKSSLDILYLLIKYECDYGVNRRGESVLYLSMVKSLGLAYDAVGEGQDVFLCGDISKIHSNPFRKPGFFYPDVEHMDMFRVVCNKVDFRKETNAQFNSLLACACAPGERQDHTNLVCLLENQSLVQYESEMYCWDSQSDILQFILKYTPSDFSKEKALEFIYTVLSFGYTPDESEVYKAFSIFGNYPLYRSLLELELRSKEVASNFILPCILLNFSVPVNQSLLYCGLYMYSHEDQLSNEEMLLNMQTIVRFCTNLNLWEFFEQFLKDSGLTVDRKLGAVLQRRVPSLLELSRNELRWHLCNQFKLKNSYQFYRFVQAMDIPQIIKDIVRFIFPIYAV